MVHHQLYGSRLQLMRVSVFVRHSAKQRSDSAAGILMISLRKSRRDGLFLADIDNQ